MCAIVPGCTKVLRAGLSLAVPPWGHAQTALTDATGCPLRTPSRRIGTLVPLRSSTCCSSVPIFLVAKSIKEVPSRAATLILSTTPKEMFEVWPPPALPRRRTDNGGVRASCRGLPTMAVTASAAAAVLRCGGARVCCDDIGKGCDEGRIRCPPAHLGRNVDAASSPAPFCIPSPWQLSRCPQGMKTPMFWLHCVQPCSTYTATNIPFGHESTVYKRDTLIM